MPIWPAVAFCNAFLVSERTMKTLSGALLGLVMLAASLSPVVKAAEQVPNSGDVIEGMGERMPPGKKDVSRSPLFKAYVFEKAGLKFVHINSL